MFTRRAYPSCAIRAELFSQPTATSKEAGHSPRGCRRHRHAGALERWVAQTSAARSLASVCGALIRRRFPTPAPSIGAPDMEYATGVARFFPCVSCCPTSTAQLSFDQRTIPPALSAKDECMQHSCAPAVTSATRRRQLDSCVGHPSLAPF